jgi:hypothetical protein
MVNPYLDVSEEFRETSGDISMDEIIDECRGLGINCVKAKKTKRSQGHLSIGQPDITDYSDYLIIIGSLQFLKIHNSKYSEYIWICIYFDASNRFIAARVKNNYVMP